MTTREVSSQVTYLVTRGKLFIKNDYAKTKEGDKNRKERHLHLICNFNQGMKRKSFEKWKNDEVISDSLNDLIIYMNLSLSIFIFYLYALANYENKCYPFSVLLLLLNCWLICSFCRPKCIQRTNKKYKKLIFLFSLIFFVENYKNIEIQVELFVCQIPKMYDQL